MEVCIEKKQEEKHSHQSKKTITTSSLLPDEAYELLYIIKSDHEDDVKSDHEDDIEDLMSDCKFIDLSIVENGDAPDKKEKKRNIMKSRQFLFLID